MDLMGFFFFWNIFTPLDSLSWSSYYFADSSSFLEALTVCLSVHLFFSPSICSSICPYIHPFVRPPIHPFIFPPVHPSTRPFVHLSVHTTNVDNLNILTFLCRWFFVNIFESCEETRAEDAG